MALQTIPTSPHPNNNNLRATSTAGKDNQNKDNKGDNGDNSNPSWRKLAAIRLSALATDFSETELVGFVLAKTFTLLTKNTKKNNKKIRTEARGSCMPIKACPLYGRLKYSNLPPKRNQKTS